MRSLHRFQGLSLIEILLVITVGLSMGAVGLWLHQKRLQDIEVMDALKKLDTTTSSMYSLSKTVTSFDILNGRRIRDFLPPQVLDGKGLMSTSYGSVHLKSFTIQTPSDSYIVSFENLPAAVCSALILKQPEAYSGIYVNARLVHEYGKAPNVSLVSESCNKKAQNNVSFVSFRIGATKDNGFSLLDKERAIGSIALAPALPPAQASAGSILTEPPSTPPPAESTGMLGIGTAGTTVNPVGYMAPGFCNPTSFSWGQGSSSGVCKDSIKTAVPNKGSYQAENQVNSYEGKALFLCDNSLWVPADASANTCVPKSCAPLPVLWGSGCSGSTPAMEHNQSITLQSSAPSTTGTASYMCNKGVVLPIAGSATCALQ